MSERPPFTLLPTGAWQLATAEIAALLLSWQGRLGVDLEQPGDPGAKEGQRRQRKWRFRFRLPSIGRRSGRSGSSALGERLKLCIGTAAGAALGVSIIVSAILSARAEELMAFHERMAIVAVTDAEGTAVGALVPPQPLITLPGGGSVDDDEPAIARTMIPVERGHQDFMRAFETLESGFEIAGLSPRIANSAACSIWERIRGGNSRDCPGSSTTLMQISRSLRDDRSYTYGRKADEMIDAMALWLAGFRQNSEARAQLAAETLFFGNAAGMPLYGLRATSRAVFGREPEQLQLHEIALLAAMPKRPARLTCFAPNGDQLTRFGEQRDRALLALRNGFASDLRMPAAVQALQAMSPITRPSPLRGPAAAGLNAGRACVAGAHPINAFRVIDDSARATAEEELESDFFAARRPTSIRLSTILSEQRAFKTAIRSNAQAMVNSGDWVGQPLFVAFVTDPQGGLVGLYRNPDAALLANARPMASIAKIPALLFLAENGFDPSALLCNRRVRGRTNAGGDPGVSDCSAPGAMQTVTDVWGRSMNLPLYHVLRRYPAARIREAAARYRFTIPDGMDPALALAFGDAQASPLHAAALMAAVSNGVAGRPARAPFPHIISHYGDAEGIHRVTRPDVIDLSAAFSTAQQRELITTGATAALRHPRGTLAQLAVQSPPAAVAKTGTLDDDFQRVRFKIALGAWYGGSWLVMAAPQRGPLGNSRITVLPLARTAAQLMVERVAQSDEAGREFRR